jgi:uncharacterized protein (DUF2249 family)
MMIEDSAPMPPAYGSLVGTLRTMEIGQSFKFDSDRLPSVRSAVTLERPRKFTIRKVEGGHRCWRTA